MLKFLPIPDSKHTKAGYVVNEETGCWDWKGRVLRNGYGKIAIKNVSTSAHRVAYELYKGPIPEGMMIDHLCRNRACCNPDHLEAVPHIENVRRGSYCKLTIEQAEEIRRMWKRGIRQRVIAEEFSVSVPTISMVVNNHTWK